MPDKIIKTGISQAFWLTYNETANCINPDCGDSNIDLCSRNCKISEIKPALLDFDGENCTATSWLDVLFRGGIKIPESAKPIIFLLSGPPGGGKSTFLLELCYRLASNNNINNGDVYSSLYVSFDTKGKPIIEIAEKYGWKDAKRVFFNYKKSVNDDFESLIRTRQNVDTDLGIVTILDKETLDFSKYKNNSIFKYIGNGLDIAAKAITGISSEGLFKKLVNALPDGLMQQNEIADKIKRLQPKIIVLDSLNIIKKDEQEFFFNKIIKRIGKTKKSDIDLIIVVIDDNYEKNAYFDYLADIVVRIDSLTENNYYIRNFEIIKTRYQDHVLGKHYFKINSKFIKPDLIHNSLCDVNIKNQRAHPYNEEGGFFVIPSIHFYLSKYRKLTAPLPQRRIEPYPETLNELFQFPNGRCTSFIGNRGTHRSHLAYLQVLFNLLQGDCTGLIISLREDEKLTKDTIQKIYTGEFGPDSNNTLFSERFATSNGKIDYYIDNNKLEILHFLPGYITPNEFFHRIFINASRLRSVNRNLIVVFNSLEQLAPRFPLCAKEDLFISSIIDFFHGLGITAIFIGVDNPAQPIEGYGLLPLSDLILSFYNYKREYQENGNSVSKYETVLKVIKNSGGINAGGKGILSLEDKISFKKIDSNEDEGQRIQSI